MNPDMTRRTLLQMAGASSLAAAAAARADGNAGGGTTFASRTPMRVGMVGLRVRPAAAVAAATTAAIAADAYFYGGYYTSPGVVYYVGPGYGYPAVRYGW